MDRVGGRRWEVVLFAIAAMVVAALGTGCPAPSGPPAQTTSTQSFPSTSRTVLGADVQGTIISPVTGQDVASETLATGSVRNLQDSQQVWLIVEIGRLYPQDGPLPLLPNGTWSGTMFVGAVGDVDKRFFIHLVSVGRDGSRQFLEYLRRGRGSGEFIGILKDELARDVKFLDTATVTRR